MNSHITLNIRTRTSNRILNNPRTTLARISSPLTNLSTSTRFVNINSINEQGISLTHALFINQTRILMMNKRNIRTLRRFNSRLVLIRRHHKINHNLLASNQFRSSNYHHTTRQTRSINQRRNHKIISTLSRFTRKFPLNIYRTLNNFQASRIEATSATRRR